MPQLVGQMAMAKFQQSLQPKEEKPGFTLGQGQIRFGPKGTEIARGTKKDETAEEWKQLPPITIGGAKIYPQKNTKSGKIIYNRFPPKPEGVKGAVTARLSKQQQMLVNKQQAGLRQINSVLKQGGIKDLDVLELMALEGPAQMEYLQQQTKPLIERLAEPHKSKLKRLYKQVENITTKIIGPMPKIPLDADTAKSLLEEVGGDKEKARKLAIERGYEY